MKTEKELLEAYDFVAPFFEGLARVEKDNRWFHIHPDGRPAYEERFDFACSFSEGRAFIKKNGKWFHIRPNGSRVR
ncbi:MAG: WG repeat-containing protein [Candidatus Pacebacteria bacterium]|nr:WG repeat-containing protein [Candidatus Paceibacterota bacterium]